MVELADHTLMVADPSLSSGPLDDWVGVWRNADPGGPSGWSMIALPCRARENFRFDYRLLLQQFDETLTVTAAESSLSNRGVSLHGNVAVDDHDQRLHALNYQQQIRQRLAQDFPPTDRLGAAGQVIHHEAGLWLYTPDAAAGSASLAKSSSIAHGSSVMAVGGFERVQGAAVMPAVDTLPIGVQRDLNAAYLWPYRHFQQQPFLGLFDPTRPADMLQAANQSLAAQGLGIEQTLVIHLDTKAPSAGIASIPFVSAQANVSRVLTTYHLQTLRQADGGRRLRMQYQQVIMLEFFERRDGIPGLIRWPHVVVNTLDKQA